MPSRTDSKLFFSRRPRWKAMAKRCVSSRTAWTSLSAAEVRSRRMPVAGRGREQDLLFLGDGDERDVGEAERGQGLLRRAELGLAAVDHDQVGEGRPLVEELAVSPGDDLARLATSFEPSTVRMRNLR